MSDEPSMSAPTPSVPDRPADSRGAVDWMPGTGGIFAPGLAALVALALLALGATDAQHHQGAATICLAIFVALAGWVVLVRPRVGIAASAAAARVPGALVLRGMVSQVAVPLTSITGVHLRQTLVVTVGERRWHSPVVGASRRQLAGRRPSRVAFAVPLGPFGDSTAPSTPRATGPVLADVVLGRIERARQDAALHRVPGGEARRTWAWVEIVGLVLSAGASAVLYAV